MISQISRQLKVTLYSSKEPIQEMVLGKKRTGKKRIGKKRTGKKRIRKRAHAEKSARGKKCIRK